MLAKELVMVVKVYSTLWVSLMCGVNWSMLFQRLTQVSLMCLVNWSVLFQRLTQVAQQQVRHRTSLPFNTIILFVPQQEAWVVERFGKFQKVLNPVSSVSFVLRSRNGTSFAKLAQLGLDLFTQNQLYMWEHLSYGCALISNVLFVFLDLLTDHYFYRLLTKKWD